VARPDLWASAAPQAFPEKTERQAKMVSPVRTGSPANGARPALQVNVAWQAPPAKTARPEKMASPVRTGSPANADWLASAAPQDSQEKMVPRVKTENRVNVAQRDLLALRVRTVCTEKMASPENAD
jgi:hypothetical protein